MSQGIELEPIGKTYHAPPKAITLKELSNRPKSWQLEPM